MSFARPSEIFEAVKNQLEETTHSYSDIIGEVKFDVESVSLSRTNSEGNIYEAVISYTESDRGEEVYEFQILSETMHEGLTFQGVEFMDDRTRTLAEEEEISDYLEGKI